MTEPSASAPHPRPCVKARILRARLVLLWEQVWRGLWPATGIISLVVAASFLDLWSVLPNALHGLILLAALGAMGAALWQGFRGFRFPAREQAMRRLEADSGLSHRPLAALNDRLAAGRGDPASESLWQAHRARLAEKAAHLHLTGPAPGLSQRDPFALRFLVLLLLGTAALIAGRDWDRRLDLALRFGFGEGSGQTIRLDAWINPPAYTGAAPIFLLEGAAPNTAAAPMPVAAPQASTLVVRVYGTQRAPQLSFAPSGTRHTIDKRLSAQQEGVFAIEEVLRQNGVVTLRKGARTLARFALSLKPDLPPKVAFTDAIRTTRQGVLRLNYRIEDDFGVTAATLRVRKADAEAHAAEVVQVPLSLPSQRTREAKLQAYVDLTAHAWAGLPVTLELAAKDEAGQEGLSNRVTFTLPERQFTDPLARALVEQRKHLARDSSRAHEVARFLEAATLAPERFVPTASLYLGLRSAFWRLTERGDKKAIAETGDLLWQIAVSLEEGDRARAEDALAAARKDLMDALARNAPQDEIERLIGALKEALDRYLAALEEEAQRALAEGRVPATLPPGAHVISRMDFDKLLESIGNLSRTGARDAARELLSGLDDILQNLSTNYASGPAPGTPEAAANDALQALSELIGKERGLMDDTFRQSMAPDEDGKSGPQKNRKLGDRQDELRATLGSILKGLGEADAEVPESFGRADRAMRDAHQALGQSQWPRAVESEKKSIEELRAGAQALAQSAFAKGAGQGMAGGEARGTGMPSTDPFGRPTSRQGTDFGGSVKVPEAMELRRAREILDEIERRASERNRPREELDYLQRLLKRF